MKIVVLGVITLILVLWWCFSKPNIPLLDSKPPLDFSKEELDNLLRKCNAIFLAPDKTKDDVRVFLRKIGCNETQVEQISSVAVGLHNKLDLDGNQISQKNVLTFGRLFIKFGRIFRYHRHWVL